MDWSDAISVAAVFCAAIVGVALTFLTLPGTWLMLLTMVCVAIWKPGMFAWYTFVMASMLAVLGEVIEFLAGAAGARRFGGGRRAALGATVGSILGAILGSFVVPILGTIIGAVAGAGAGAIVAERYWATSEWRDAARVGAGAAAGRLAAVLAKGGCACVMAVIMIVASLVP